MHYSRRSVLLTKSLLRAIIVPKPSQGFPFHPLRARTGGTAAPAHPRQRSCVAASALALVSARRSARLGHGIALSAVSASAVSKDARSPVGCNGRQCHATVQAPHGLAMLGSSVHFHIRKSIMRHASLCRSNGGIPHADRPKHRSHTPH